jgi:integrase
MRFPVDASVGCDLARNARVPHSDLLLTQARSAKIDAGRIATSWASRTDSRCSFSILARYLPQPAYTIVAVAAFLGLRRAEIRGLEWPDYTGEEIRIMRSVWESVTNEPKTRRSKAPVLVIPALARILDAYREQCGKPESGPMFASEAKTPLNLNNLLNRVILPALNRREVCRKERTEHVQADHEFKRDVLRPEWHGWHAFRRGLATNLHLLGVNDKTIQAILRHSNIATTMNIYVKTVSEVSTAAMKLLETALCANRAPAPTPDGERMVN